MTPLSDMQTYCTHDHRVFYELAARYRKPGMRTADIGAGDGQFADLLGDSEIHLIEGNPDSAAKLRARYRNVIEVTLPNRLPLDDAALDFIHCSHLIEHLAPQDLYALLKELDRCLAPSGILAISTPLMWEGFYDDLTHIRPYAPFVLEKYICGQFGTTRTRSAISASYTIVELQYRWRMAPFPVLNASYSWRRLQRTLHGLSRLLKRLNVGYYERTGYTMIMQKGASDDARR